MTGSSDWINLVRKRENNTIEEDTPMMSLLEIPNLVDVVAIAVMGCRNTYDCSKNRRSTFPLANADMSELQEEALISPQGPELV